LLQYDIFLLQYDIFLSQYDIFLARYDVFLLRYDILFARYDIHPLQNYNLEKKNVILRHFCIINAHQFNSTGDFYYAGGCKNISN